MVKKYKLIKKYPDSPEIGFIVEWNYNGMNEKYCYTGANPMCRFRNDLIENYPEFWKEVKEKDYEILTVIAKWSSPSDSPGDIVNYNKLYDYDTIHSVKRLSDGEVFTVGDKVNPTDNRYWNGEKYSEFKSGSWRDDFYPTTIRSFKVIEQGLLVIYDTNKHYDSGQLINHIEKVKQPLFVTEDGKEIFESSRVYLVKGYKSLTREPYVVEISDWRTYFGDKGKPIESDLAFSTKEAAEKWIDENKPVYSKRDIEEALLNPLSGFWERAYGRLFEEKLNYGKA